MPTHDGGVVCATPSSEPEGCSAFARGGRMPSIEIEDIKAARREALRHTLR
jgi:hypothetical protein